MNRKVIFLDRDGTIIKDQHYLKNINDIEILPGVISGLKQLNNAGYDFIIITNQSGIARGLFNKKEYQLIQSKVESLFLEHKIHFLDTYFCPHHPTEGSGIFTKECKCRKPKPGLIYQAIKDHSVDPEKSVMIGDKERDILAGIAAKCTTILLTKEEVKSLATYQCPTLISAAETILNRG